MVIKTGKLIAKVARDLGVHDGTLGNWVMAWRREHPEPDPPISPVERARVSELEEETAGGALRADRARPPRARWRPGRLRMPAGGRTAEPGGTCLLGRAGR
jgi:transposase-like protein